MPHSEKRAIRAIIFDLYGTLLSFSTAGFIRDLRRELAAARVSEPESMPVDRGGIKALLDAPLDEQQFSARLCTSITGHTPTVADLETCARVLKENLKKVQVRRHARTVLPFLKGRGFKIGLLSNSAAPFKAPFEGSGLSEWFDEVLFSCDIGVSKPSRRAYELACDRLGVDCRECLFVGDSIRNDYEVPKSLGMRAFCLKSLPADQGCSLSDLGELAWRIDAAGQTLTTPLVSMSARAGDDPDWGPIENVESQGRYNIVAKAREPLGHNKHMFFKRYLLPNSAHVEFTAYRLLRALGMPVPDAALLGEDEPILAVQQCPGVPWAEAQVDPRLMESVGQHCAMGYILANADLRPRNSFVCHSGGTATMYVIDLEHCFFDRILALPEGFNASDPRAIDGLNSELGRLTLRRVVSTTAVRRVRRMFCGHDSFDSEWAHRFRSGWLNTYETCKQQLESIDAILRERIYQQPPLMLGTHAYRRAMAAIDLTDIESRIAEDPHEVFTRCY